MGTRTIDITQHLNDNCTPEEIAALTAVANTEETNNDQSDE